MAPLGSTATLDTLASCQLAPPHILDACHNFGGNSQSNKPLNIMDGLAFNKRIISTLTIGSIAKKGDTCTNRANFIEVVTLFLDTKP